MPQDPDATVTVPRSLLFDLCKAATAAIYQAKADADDAIARLRALPIDKPGTELFVEIAAFRTAQRDYEAAQRRAYNFLNNA